MPKTGLPRRTRNVSNRNVRDQFAGLLIVVAGALIAHTAVSYAIGTPSDPGPGFFPFYLGVILCVLGAMITTLGLRARLGDGNDFAIEPRAFLGVLVPVIVFGLLLIPAGLVVATFVTIVAASLASREFHLRGSLLNAVTMCAIVFVGFSLILGIQIPVWPSRLISWLT